MLPVLLAAALVGAVADGRHSVHSHSPSRLVRSERAASPPPASLSSAGAGKKEAAVSVDASGALAWAAGAAPPERHSGAQQDAEAAPAAAEAGALRLAHAREHNRLHAAGDEETSAEAAPAKAAAAEAAATAADEAAGRGSSGSEEGDSAANASAQLPNATAASKAKNATARGAAANGSSAAANGSAAAREAKAVAAADRPTANATKARSAAAAAAGAPASAPAAAANKSSAPRGALANGSKGAAANGSATRGSTTSTAARPESSQTPSARSAAANGTAANGTGPGGARANGSTAAPTPTPAPGGVTGGGNASDGSTANDSNATPAPTPNASAGNSSESNGSAANVSTEVPSSDVGGSGSAATASDGAADAKPGAASAGKGSPSDRAMQTVDGSQDLSEADRVLKDQTLSFARAMLAAERRAQCPDKPEEVSFTMKSASVQVTEEIVVKMLVDVGGQNRTFKVEWLPSHRRLTPLQRDALSKSQDDDSSGHGGLIDAGAKLILPVPACSLGISPADGASLAGGDALDAEGLPPGFRERALRQAPGVAFGLVVDEELRAYRAGLMQQGEDLHGSSWGHTVKYAVFNDGTTMTTTYPATLEWRTLKPACLDYVHHQGDCGACYMFAALDSLSDRHCINMDANSSLGKADHLSIQQGILCEPLGRQCAGGWAEIAFNHSKVIGLGTEAEWGYERSCLSEAVCAFGSQCMVAPPVTYQCSNFFNTEDLDGLQTMHDAFLAATRKCAKTSLSAECAQWVGTRFKEGSSELFAASQKFCSAVAREFASFLGSDLLQEQALARRSRAAGTDRAGMLLGTRRLLDQTTWWKSSGSGYDDDNFNNSLGSPTTAAPSTSQASTTTAGPTADTAGPDEVAIAAANCDRARCLSDGTPHHATDFHYMWNFKDHFKYELYNFGPFYTSFYVYEDFTWFFEQFPTEGYNLQWGGMLGGHAVAAVGWDGNCQYHLSRNSLLEITKGRTVQGGERKFAPPAKPSRMLDELGSGFAFVEDDSEVSADESYEQLYVRATSARRRRVRKGECWLMRNSWGDDWGDGGYFRMKDDMLTGDEGTHLHIASSAADGPWSEAGH